VLDLLPLQRVFTAIKIDVFALLGNAGDGGEVLRDRDVDGRIAECAAWSGDNMTDRAHGLLSSKVVGNGDDTAAYRQAGVIMPQSPGGA
jgi:hypothetical protein